jgi:acetylornithine deacetylase/succinyl-diaminopimelate desuccinylase-like protein
VDFALPERAVGNGNRAAGVPELGNFLPDWTDNLPGPEYTLPGSPDAVPGPAHCRPDLENSLPGLAKRLPDSPDTLPGLPDSLPVSGESGRGVTFCLPGPSDTLPGVIYMLPGLADTLPGSGDRLPEFRSRRPPCSRLDIYAQRPISCRRMTRTERLLAELIALPSVNPAFVPPDGTSARQARQPHPFAGEQRVADFLAAVAARAGLEIEFQKVLPGRSNLIARLLPGNNIRQTILLAPHLDTVGADGTKFIPQRKDGRLYGRGACDTKGSVAAMLSALCELANAKSRPLETEIVFAGLIDEEHAQAGSRALVAQASRLQLAAERGSRDGCATLAIIGEPTKLRVVTAHKGSLWLELETHGRAAHGAMPQLGKNAIHEMARIVDLLETDYAAQLRRRKHPLLGTATVNVGTISGGAQPNIVPDRCKITVDRRTLPGETDAGVQREIAAFLRAGKLSANISNSKLAPALPLETNPKLPLVRRFLKSAGQSKPLGVNFFCDAAVLSAGGIPSVVFGPGDVAQAHTVDEWISLAELERGKDLILKFLKSLP